MEETETIYHYQNKHYAQKQTVNYDRKMTYAMQEQFTYNIRLQVIINSSYTRCDVHIWIS